VTRRSETERLAWWGVEKAGLSLAAAWFAVGGERAGEDANPCVCVAPNGSRGLIAVLDGLGGAGTTKVWQLAQDEAPLTGACVGAHVASVALLNAYREKGKLSAAQMKDGIVSALREAEAVVNVPKPGFSGSALRSFPTTLASMQFAASPNAEGQVEASVVWLGDSRCYVMRPVSGLMQVSRDDTRGGPDAQQALRDAPPMTGTIGLDRPFELHQRDVGFPTPAVIVVCSDGCTDYVATPHQLEHRLLKTMGASGSAVEWAQLLGERTADVAGDDASLVLAAIGYPSFAALKLAYEPRWRWVDELDANTIRRADPHDSGSRDAAADAAWSAYRTTYERYEDWVLQ
jgi:serine/threonine protein phosphatase PrpC